jgi:predicted PurR-regulated permease PerM
MRNITESAGSESVENDHIGIRRAVSGLLVVLTFGVLYYAQAVVIPVLLAVLVTYALEPVARRLNRWHVPRPLAAMLTIVVLYSAVGFTAYNLRGRMMAVVASLPEASEKLRAAMQPGRGSANPQAPMSQIQQAATEIQKAALVVSGEPTPSKDVPRVQIAPAPFDVQGFLWSGTRGFLEWTGQAVVLTFLVYFLLASGDLYKRKMVRLIGSTWGHKRLTVEALQEINSQMERFLLVQVMTSVLVALATWLLLALMGMHNAVVWAVAAGILNSIPYFGAIVVSVGLALVAFLQFGTLLATIQIAGGAFVITSLEGMLLTPALMGKAAGINQVAMFVSLLFWGWMWGVVGTLLAVPIMMMVKIVCERVEGLQEVGELLNER